MFYAYFVIIFFIKVHVGSVKGKRKMQRFIICGWEVQQPLQIMTSLSYIIVRLSKFRPFITGPLKNIFSRGEDQKKIIDEFYKRYIMKK